MKDKHLFILMIPIFVFIALHAGFMVVSAQRGPVKLSVDEVTFYENAANAYLNHEKTPYKSNTNETINYIQGKDKVTVASNNIFKETVTAYLEDGQLITKTNSPNVDFTGCMIFHTIILIASICAAGIFLMTGVDEFRKSAKAR